MTRLVTLSLVAGAFIVPPSSVRAAAQFDTAGCIGRATANCAAAVGSEFCDDSHVIELRDGIATCKGTAVKCREAAISLCLTLAERKLHFERAPKK